MQSNATIVVGCYGAYTVAARGLPGAVHWFELQCNLVQCSSMQIYAVQAVVGARGLHTVPGVYQWTTLSHGASLSPRHTSNNPNRTVLPKMRRVMMIIRHNECYWHEQV